MAGFDDYTVDGSGEELDYFLKGLIVVLVLILAYMLIGGQSSFTRKMRFRKMKMDSTPVSNATQVNLPSSNYTDRTSIVTATGFGTSSMTSRMTAKQRAQAQLVDARI
jgi:hypothetical protein